MDNICVELKHLEMQGMQSSLAEQTACSKPAAGRINGAAAAATGAIHGIVTGIGKRCREQHNLLNILLFHFERRDGTLYGRTASLEGGPATEARAIFFANLL
jgi:hypothetical protein